MHALYMDPAVLKMGQPYALQREHSFGSEQVEISGNNHSPHDSPQHSYHNNFDFSVPAPSSFEPQYSSASYHTSFSAPLPLHQLNTTTLWPSQLTNPSPPSSSSPPAALPLQPRPLAPVTQDSSREQTSAPSPPPPPARATPASTSTRKTLTDNDRRRMCRYHEENPTVKQNEIGAMFGVERSTVSKVLRQKEKHLASDEGRKTPLENKKPKGKLPDIERTLSNWAKNRLNEHLPIDDAMLRDEARKFASTLGSAACNSQVNDPVWLEKFKQRNQLPGVKPKGEKLKPESLSPKPDPHWDGTPVNAVKQEDSKAKSPVSVFNEGDRWGHGHSQSTTMLGSLIADVGFSNDFRSPTSPSFFTPVSSSGPSPAMLAQKAPRLPILAPAKVQRRQTVPLAGNDDESPRSTTSKHGAQGLPPMDSIHDEMDISPSGINTSIPHHSRPSTTISTHSEQNSANTNNSSSPFSMYPPSSAMLATNISPTTGSTTSPPNSASPSCPPSQDEARAALETLRKFMEHQPDGAIDPHDYLVLGKWMQILRLDGRNLPGGMYTIPMTERADGTAPIGRKRSEHSLS